VIGEDLGTVEPAVARTLAAYGLPGCQVLWFARAVNDDTGAQSGPLLVAEEWRELALASITTHDLPTAAGFLQGEHVRVRAELGQLTRSESEEWGTFRRDRAELLDLLVGEGVLDGADLPVEEVVVAMHRHLARTPSRLVAITLEDLVGEVRQPNLPGTVDEYPNWRHRLALSLEDLPAAPLAARLVAVLTEAMAGGGRPTARGVR
jgi:4-alpha-glucanotransferase